MYLLRSLLLIFLCLCLFISTETLRAQQFTFTPSPIDTLAPAISAKIKKAYEERVKNLPEGLNGKERAEIKEYYASGRQMLEEMLSSGEFILNSDLYDYTEGVLQKIIAANPELDPHMILLVSRSPRANAFNTGDGFIIITTGLLMRLENESQLAFTLSHEAAHQYRKHVNISIEQEAKAQVDPERRRQIKAILKKEYLVRTNLENFFLPGMMSKMRFSRAKEFEADSLGYYFFTSAGYDAKAALRTLQILDQSDREYRSDFRIEEGIFSLENVPFKPEWLGREEEASLGTFVRKKAAYEDSLKTHPECPLRIRAIEYDNQIAFDTTQAFPVDPSYARYRFDAECETIQGLILLGNYGQALHNCLSLMKAYPQLEYARQTLAHIMSHLAVHKKNRTAGRYLDVTDPDNTDNYNATLDFIWNLSDTDCAAIGYYIVHEPDAGTYENKTYGRYVLAKSAYAFEKYHEFVDYAMKYVNANPGTRYSNELNNMYNNLLKSGKLTNQK